eukprot:11159168-Lingulodinium_polyedra.AAC.1
MGAVDAAREPATARACAWSRQHLDKPALVGGTSAIRGLAAAALARGRGMGAQAVAFGHRA